MQYKVPQGVEMQDRILGPLTLVQFGFVLFGGLVAYFLYLKMPHPFGFWFAASFFTLSLAFSFDSVRKMVIAGILFIVRPRQRVWHKISTSEGSQNIQSRKPQLKNKGKKKFNYRDSQQLADILDKKSQTK